MVQVYLDVDIEFDKDINWKSFSLCVDNGVFTYHESMDNAHGDYSLIGWF